MLPAALKRAGRDADTGGVDATERKEILNRYKDHSRRFEAAAARRGSGRTGSVIPFAPPVLRELEQEPTAREIEVLQLVADGLVNRDGEVSRPPPPREATSAQQSPRRSRGLPAWAHRLILPSVPVASALFPATPKEGCRPWAQKRGFDGLPVLHAGKQAGTKEATKYGFPHSLISWIGN